MDIVCIFLTIILETKESNLKFAWGSGITGVNDFVLCSFNAWKNFNWLIISFSLTSLSQFSQYCNREYPGKTRL